MALWDGVVAVIGTIDDGPQLSRHIVAPNADVGTLLHRGYSLAMGLTNTRLLRDARDRRIAMDLALTITVAHRLNPRDEVGTLRLATRDAQNIIIRLCSSTADPLCHVETAFDSMSQELSDSREWVFHELLFRLTFGLSLDDAEITS